jgi:hypothetical protein
MANPYGPPASIDSYENSTSGTKSWSRRQFFAAAASVVAVIVLSIVSYALITQALRLDSESAKLPRRLQADYASTARSSWIGGIAAIAGIVLNVGSLAFIRKNKLIVPLALHVVTVLGMIAIAIMFKPS